MILGIWPAIGWSQAIDTGDTAWMLTSTALVLFMTLPGLALFYAGLVWESKRPLGDHAML